MFSLTWFDIFIALLLSAIPYFMGAVILFLLARSFRHAESRVLLLGLILPQCLATLMVWWGLHFYHVYTTFRLFVTASVAMLGGMVLCFLLFRSMKSVAGRLVLSHLFALALYFFIIDTFSPGLYAELQTGRDMRQLRNIGQSNDEFNRRLEDSTFRQNMLLEAVFDADMPETTFQGLLARDASPFHIYAYNSSLFSAAVESHNLIALRVFSQQLDGNDKQTKSNRTFLRKYNPLEQHFYFSVSPTEEEKQQYKTIVKLILDKMPELLSDKVYAEILPVANADLIQFLWDYHPPEKVIYRIQAEALLGKLAVVDKIVAAPGILTRKPAADYAKTLWEYLIQYAPRPVVQAILMRNVVQWTDYKDKKGNNPVLKAAIGRAKKYTGDDPQVLTLVMRDIAAHRAPWSPSQLAQGFYTEEEGSHVVSALYNAGITCIQLRKALSDFLHGQITGQGKSRIEDVCGEENKVLSH